MSDLARWRRYRWQLITSEAFDPAMQLAVDEVLTRRVGAGRRPPTLRFWEWKAPAVVIGRFQSVRNEVDLEVAERHGITIVRRISGGGAMLNEPGRVITYSIYAPPELVSHLSLRDSYAFFDAWVVEALQTLGIEAWYQPINDIACTQGKIGGAAQARRSGVVLHHTTIAYDIDPEKVPQIIRIGRESLSKKGVRSANKRVAPLRLQTDLPRETIQAHLIRTFAERHGLEEGELSPDELEEARNLAWFKYATWEWTAILP